MGVILLVNMMIALLSNTYQRVEVTSRHTCSFILFSYAGSVATCVREQKPTTLIYTKFQLPITMTKLVSHNQLVETGI